MATSHSSHGGRFLREKFESDQGYSQPSHLDRCLSPPPTVKTDRCQLGNPAMWHGLCWPPEVRGCGNNHSSDSGPVGWECRDGSQKQQYTHSGLRRSWGREGVTVGLGGFGQTGVSCIPRVYTVTGVRAAPPFPAYVYSDDIEEQVGENSLTKTTPPQLSVSPVVLQIMQVFEGEKDKQYKYLMGCKLNNAYIQKNNLNISQVAMQIFA